MNLKTIQSRKSLTVLGLNSGTSADGLDMAVVRIAQKGSTLKTSFITGSSRKYSEELRAAVLSLADSSVTTLEEVIRIDSDLGRFYGRSAASYIKRLAAANIRIDLIASHGQTVRHYPGSSSSGTLQLGCLNRIATITGKITAGDFRQADIALGNEGAPITSAAISRLLSARGESRLIVNIGGMANYFYLPPINSGGETKSADCGPGNAVIDILSLELFGEAFDRGGRRAATGTIDRRLLAHLESDKFFARRTRSTGREQFGQPTVEKIKRFRYAAKLAPEDILATVTEFTVSTIVRTIRPLLKADRTLSKLYLTGGGRKNIFLRKRLQTTMPELDIRSIDELGINGDLVEAASYAVMGEAVIRSRPLPTDSGGKTKSGLFAVLGLIAQPPQRQKVAK